MPVDLRRLPVPVTAATAALAFLVSGPVAALIAAVYTLLGARALTRRTRRRADSARHARSLDNLCALAADLRAGLPPAPPSTADPRVAALTDAVWRLAERTGAPAADLVERIEADLRAAARARGSAEAQAAGARMTAALLAALPAAGLALGESIGADALTVLLTTTPGALCTIGALTLQLAGLAWSARLISGATR